MKKKILLSLLVIVGLFTITGCGSPNTKYDKNGKYVEYIELIRNQKTSTYTDNKSYGELLDAILPDSKYDHYNGYLGQGDEEAISLKGKHKNTKESYEIVFVVSLNNQFVKVEKIMIDGKEQSTYSIQTGILKEGYDELNK